MSQNKEKKQNQHTTTALIFDIGHSPFGPPIYRSWDVLHFKELQVWPQLWLGIGKAQASGFELVGGEISKGVQRKGISGISHVVVFGDEVMIVLEHPEPVQPFLLRRVRFAMLLGPGLE